MIHIIFCRNDEEMTIDEFKQLEASLPAKFQGTFDRYRRWQDRQAGVLGKVLLRELLSRHAQDVSVLGRYEVDEYERPRLPVAGDFNISHTDGLVVAAYHSSLRVGIDVERVKPIDPTEFNRVFTTAEINALELSADPITLFYNTWTKKEAAMKSDGRGFYLDASQYETGQSSVVIGEYEWFYTKVPVPEGFICHCSASEKQAVSVVELRL